MISLTGALALYAPSLIGSYSIGAVRFSGNPANHGTCRDIVSGELLPGYGSLAGDFDLSSDTAIRAGGRSGEGLRIDNHTVINCATFLYRDDGQQLALREISGFRDVADLRMDVTADWQPSEACKGQTSAIPKTATVSFSAACSRGDGAGGAQTAVYGVSMQNFDIRANLTGTPMP